jgi:Na+-translocating ferredoxin:NAD+ oxidoreductase RnfE subunit
VDLGFDGMLIAILPPGAFFGLAGLLALKNWLGARERLE